MKTKTLKLLVLPLLLTITACDAVDSYECPSFDSIFNGDDSQELASFWACQEYEPKTDETTAFGISFFKNGTGNKFNETGFEKLGSFVWGHKECSPITLRGTFGNVVITKVQGSIESGAFSFTTDDTTASCVLKKF